MNLSRLTLATPYNYSQNTGINYLTPKTKKHAIQRPKSSYIVSPQEVQSIKQRIQISRLQKQNTPKSKKNITTNNLTYSIHTNTFEPKHQSNSNQSIHQLLLSDFQIGDLLGRGALSKVRLAIHKQSGWIVSIKSILRQKIQDKLDVFVRGLKIQWYLDHPNIAKIYGIIVQKAHVHIILQHCVDSHLTIQKRAQLKETRQTKQLLLHISKAIEYLHNNKIQHRDLKLQNILLSFGVPKITDFQLAVKSKLDFLQRKTLCGSPAYFSPQMVVKHRYNKKADIWSLGIIFYEMLCGYFPFDYHNYEDINNILQKNIKEFPNSLTKEASQLIISMLNKDSSQRFSIQEVIQHKFFTMLQNQ